MINQLNVKDFGVVGDGETLDTVAIQAGIDACSEMGGELIFPAGCYISGTLRLKSNLTIRLTSRAVLRSSRHAEHIEGLYQCRYLNEQTKSSCFIYGEDLENVTLLGPGTIDEGCLADRFRNLCDSPISDRRGQERKTENDAAE